MKILVLSAEVWRDDQNGGNVLSNIFKGMDAEFAQVFCNPGQPSNTLCRRYYQLTDSMMLSGLFQKEVAGRLLEYDEYPQDGAAPALAQTENRTFYSFFRRFRLESFVVAKELLWSMARWDTPQLREFITSFDPDIIFAPCYASQAMLRLTRIAASVTGKPVVSYISDDNYTLCQFRLSPVYWMNRLALRRQMRKTFPLYSFVYTMTREQKQQCERDFHADMRVLCKSGDFTGTPGEGEAHQPIRLVYAGSVYQNRWKTLAKIADALAQINQGGSRMVLDIYTGSALSTRQRKKLAGGGSVTLHPVVDSATLKQIYAQSDLALHVESFQLKNRLAVRLSFSTKIIDCLDSGCAVLAVCDEKQGGYSYLKREDAALCIGSPDQILPGLQRIAQQPQVIGEYRKKAVDCGRRNHLRETIERQIQGDFNRLLEQTT